MAANRYIPVLDGKLDKEDQFVKTGTKATMFGKLKAPRFPGNDLSSVGQITMHGT
jgi:hypothetical protein